MLKKSFKLKLLCSYVLLVAVSFGFVAFFLDKNLEEQSLNNIRLSLTQQARLVAGQIETESLRKKDINALSEVIDKIGTRINARITVIDPSGKVLADSRRSYEELLVMENHLRRPEIQVAFEGEVGSEIRYSSTLKIDMLYLAVPFKQADMVIGVVRLALPLEDVRATLMTIRRTVFLSLIFALGLAFLVGSVLAQGVLKPLSKIMWASRRFSQGDFSRRIYLDSGDEIGELADILNKMAQDIEDKVKETQAQNERLKAIFQSMIEGLIVLDKAGIIVSVNPAAEKIFNVSKKEAEGRFLLEAIRNNEIAEIMQQVLVTGEFFSREVSLVWPVQGVFEISVSPLFSKDGITGCLAVVHDITEIKRLETMRRDFVANVSHELKTPLTSIKGFVETLLEGALDEKENSRHFLQIIQEHTDRLDKLINDLLNLSYLESSAVETEKSDIILKDITDEVLAGFGSQLKKKSVPAKNEVLPRLIVRADRDNLKQVLTNLIDNAIKFNRPGGVLTVGCQDLGQALKVTVEDTGSGIPAKDIPRIFERFYRVDKARSRELGGTGLGLSIVKHIIELHGGSVGVESTEGLGSKFWFTLPK